MPKNISEEISMLRNEEINAILTDDSLSQEEKTAKIQQLSQERGDQVKAKYSNYLPQDEVNKQISSLQSKIEELENSKGKDTGLNKLQEELKAQKDELENIKTNLSTKEQELKDRELTFTISEQLKTKGVNPELLDYAIGDVKNMLSEEMDITQAIGKLSTERTSLFSSAKSNGGSPAKGTPAKTGKSAYLEALQK